MAATTHTFPTESEAAIPTSPLLASSLLTDEDLDRLLDSVSGTSISSGKNNNTNQIEYLTTGLKSLDAALARGLESARIVEISGDAGAGVSEVYQKKKKSSNRKTLLYCILK